MARMRLSTLERSSIWESHGKRCVYCSEPVSFENLHIDHIIPARLIESSRDLRHEYDLPDDFEINSLLNLVPCHSRCNLRKRDIEFKKSRVLYFLELARDKYATVVELIKKKNQQEKKDEAVVALLFALEEGLLSVDDASSILENHEQPEAIFDLLRELEFPVRHLIAYLKGGDPLGVFLEHFPTVERRQAEAFLEHAVSETEEQLDRETHHAASDPA